jgi:DNA-directed RNA polymerase specialized sigma24 family protein
MARATHLEPAAVDRIADRGMQTREAADKQSRARQMLLTRAHALPKRERILLEMHWARDLSARQIAELTGEHHGTLARRIRSLRRRLESPAVAVLTDPATKLPPRDRKIALDHWLNRRSVAQLSRELEVNPHEVRRRLQWVAGWLAGRRDGASMMHRLMNRDAA